MQIKNKKKITYIASEDGLQKAEAALRRLGFETKSNFTKLLQLSPSTVNNFFQRKPIQFDSFKRICERLKLKWEEVAYFEETEEVSSRASNKVCTSAETSEGGVFERAIWQILQKKAKSLDNWLQFLTKEEMASVQRGTRGLILPPPPPAVEKMTPKIPANQSLWMVINLPFQNYQLLLLNRSQQGQALLCPSSAYAPNAIVEKSPLLLPQKDAWAGNCEEKFVFGEAGKEEFLAIVLEKPLSLFWLTPHEDEALLEWNAERMKELFEQLEQQGNWQVFYQSFDVVEK
jgi:hypothetical protein